MSADTVPRPMRQALECWSCGNREPEVLIGGLCEGCLCDDMGDARARLFSLVARA